MTPICLNHGLEPGPEGTTDLDDVVHGHGIPLLLDRGLQGVNVSVGGSTGLALNIAPNSIIQWCSIWRGRWPEVGRPEISQIVLTPLLNNLGFMAWGAVLLPAVVALGVLLIQPWLNNCLEYLQVLLCPHPEPLGRRANLTHVVFLTPFQLLLMREKSAVACLKAEIRNFLLVCHQTYLSLISMR